MGVPLDTGLALCLSKYRPSQPLRLGGAEVDFIEEMVTWPPESSLPQTSDLTDLTTLREFDFPYEFPGLSISREFGTCTSRECKTANPTFVTFTPHEGWAVLYNKNRYFTRKIPDDAFTKLGEAKHGAERKSADVKTGI